MIFRQAGRKNGKGRFAWSDGSMYEAVGLWPLATDGISGENHRWNTGETPVV